MLVLMHVHVHVQVRSQRLSAEAIVKAETSRKAVAEHKKVSDTWQ